MAWLIKIEIHLIQKKGDIYSHQSGYNPPKCRTILRVDIENRLTMILSTVTPTFYYSYLRT
jgi:hypothetical protein